MRTSVLRVPQDAESNHRRAFGFVGDADDGGFGDERVRDEDAFDLGWADTFSGDF